MNLFAFFVCVFVFPCSLIVSSDKFRLLLIHNNDMHSRFEETNAYGAPCKQSECYGGFARMKTAIREAVEDANKQNIPSIVLNAGDTFQGTPYYDFKKWHMVQPLLEEMQIDVMTLGNHEFDDGIDSLSEYLKIIKIPVVCCNLNLTSEPRLNVTNLTPFKILDVNGTKIGVIGFLTPDTESLSKTENLRIIDEIASVQAEASRLKKSGVKIIIGLGHSGFHREVEIAREIPELDVLVGGHSHSLLYSPKDKPPSVELPRESYPFMVTQKSGRKIPVVQAGALTKYLGKLMLVFDDDFDVISATGNTQLLDSTVAEDLSLKELVNQGTAPMRHDLKKVKGHTSGPLLLPDFINRQYESTLANFVTDTILDYGVRKSNDTSTRNYCNGNCTPPSVSFVNGDAFRGQIQDPGSITLEDVLMMMPYGDEIFQVQYQGWVIKKALEHSVESINSFPYYLYFSGLKVTYDLTRDINDRVVSVNVRCPDCLESNYEALQNNATYRVLIGEYLLRGGTGFSMFKEEKKNPISLGIKDKALVMKYIEETKIIHPFLDGRITVKDWHSLALESSKNSSSTNFLANTRVIFYYLFVICTLWFFTHVC